MLQDGYVTQVGTLEPPSLDNFWECQPRKVLPWVLWCCNGWRQALLFLTCWKIFLRVKVKSLSRVQLFVIPWTIAYQALQSMEFSRQEYWSALPFPSPGDLPNPGIEPGSPALQADALPSEPPGKSKSYRKKQSQDREKRDTVCKCLFGSAIHKVISTSWNFWLQAPPKNSHWAQE